MSLRITNWTNSATSENEWITMRATSDVQLESYAIVDRTFDEDGNPSNKFRHIFAFPKQLVKKDEAVRLYSKEGTYVYEPIKIEGVDVNCHKFFWNSEGRVWNNNDIDKAYLITYEVIQTKTITTTK